MNRLMPLLLGCCALLALGLGVVAWRQHTEIARLTQVAARHSDLPASVGRAQAPAVVFATPRALLRPTPGSTGTEGDFLVPGASVPVATPAPRSQPFARLMGDPKFLRMLSMH